MDSAGTRDPAGAQPPTVLKTNNDDSWNSEPEHKNSMTNDALPGTLEKTQKNGAITDPINMSPEVVQEQSGSTEQRPTTLGGYLEKLPLEVINIMISDCFNVQDLMRFARVNRVYRTIVFALPYVRELLLHIFPLVSRAFDSHLPYGFVSPAVILMSYSSIIGALDKTNCVHCGRRLEFTGWFQVVTACRICDGCICPWAKELGTGGSSGDNDDNNDGADNDNDGIDEDDDINDDVDGDEDDINNGNGMEDICSFCKRAKDGIREICDPCYYSFWLWNGAVLQIQRVGARDGKINLICILDCPGLWWYGPDRMRPDDEGLIARPKIRLLERESGATVS